MVKPRMAESNHRVTCSMEQAWVGRKFEVDVDINVVRFGWGVSFMGFCFFFWLLACRILGSEFRKVAQPNAINTEPMTTQMKRGLRFRTRV